ncbi:Uncharacterized membrane protein [bacterium A37T11]|nr:Uncharacterized membrane protein [bacterium A37T11]
MENKTPKVKDRDIQLFIGYLLRYGIWSALTVTFIGGIIYLSRHHLEIKSFSNFTEKDVNMRDFIANTMQGVIDGKGQSIIMAGILLLFLTPILRILFSLVAFFLEKDYLYVLITLIVVAIICFSVFFGFAH